MFCFQGVHLCFLGGCARWQTIVLKKIVITKNTDLGCSISHNNKDIPDSLPFTDFKQSSTHQIKAYSSVCAFCLFLLYGILSIASIIKFESKYFSKFNMTSAVLESPWWGGSLITTLQVWGNASLVLNKQVKQENIHQQLERGSRSCPCKSDELWQPFKHNTRTAPINNRWSQKRNRENSDRQSTTAEAEAKVGSLWIGKNNQTCIKQHRY